MANSNRRDAQRSNAEDGNDKARTKHDEQGVGLQADHSITQSHSTSGVQRPLSSDGRIKFKPRQGMKGLPALRPATVNGTNTATIDATDDEDDEEDEDEDDMHPSQTAATDDKPGSKTAIDLVQREGGASSMHYLMKRVHAHGAADGTTQSNGS